jgi:hypothetical protein
MVTAHTVLCDQEEASMTVSLRAALAAGEDPLGYVDHVDLWEILALAVGDRDHRERMLSTLDRPYQLLEAAGLGRDDLRLRQGWEREVLEDPTLVEGAIGAIGDLFLRLEVDLAVDISRRGYPLEVELPEGSWRCDGCGATFEAGAESAFSVGGRTEATFAPVDHGYLPAWCVGCLEDAIVRARSIYRRGQP